MRVLTVAEERLSSVTLSGGENANRSAIVTLAGVFEDRRELLKAELLRKDEGALFQIANEFGLRHNRAGEKPANVVEVLMRVIG